MARIGISLPQPVRPDERLYAAVALVLGAVFLRTTWLTLPWEFTEDANMIHYAAAKMLDGVMPYRDLFDVNFPVTFLIHAILLALFGKGDFAFRLYDLGWTLLAASGITALAWKQSRWLALAGGVYFALMHIADGPAKMLQRELLMAPFLLWATWLLMERRSRPAIALSGLLIGLAVMIKPTALLFAAFATLLLWRRGGMFVFATGTLASMGAILLWLASTGSLKPFIDIFFHFTLPVHNSPGFVNYAAPSPIMLLYGAAPLIWFLLRFRQPERFSRALIAGGVVFGAAHYWLQHKGFVQHTYMLRAFFIAWACCELPTLTVRLKAPLVTAAASLLAVLVVWQPYRIYYFPASWYAVESQHPNLDHIQENIHQAMAAVPDTLRDGRVVFFEGIAGSLWRTALKYNWQGANRCSLSMPFYIDQENDFLQELTARCAEQLKQTLPSVIIISSNSWPPSRREAISSIATYPPILKMLKEHYQPFAAGSYLIVYRVR